jgi:ubiquinone biosynthesis protein UbiJ
VGDAEVAQAFRDLLVALRPDVEEELSRYLGDAMAHTLARGARSTLDFAARSFDTLRRNVAEYLTEESRDVPTRDEVDAYIAEVDRLRSATDRLAARIALVEQRRRDGR